MKRVSVTRKNIVLILLSITLVILSFASWRLVLAPKWQSPHGCAYYNSGTFDPASPQSIQNLAQKSKAVVTATVEDRDAFENSNNPSAQRIRITEVIKGGSPLHAGTTLALCAHLSAQGLTKGPHPNVLVFLEGRDGDTWVPTWGPIGFVPKDATNRFTPAWVTSGQRSVTPDELKQLIR